MFLAVCAFAVLGLTSGMNSCPDLCHGIGIPARLEDLPPLSGRWIAVSISIKTSNGTSLATHRSDSFTLHDNNATFLTTKLRDGVCVNQEYNERCSFLGHLEIQRRSKASYQIPRHNLAKLVHRLPNVDLRHRSTDLQRPDSGLVQQDEKGAREAAV